MSNYESIMQGLQEAIDDAKGNHDLLRKTIEFSNSISSQEALKDVIPIDWDLPDNKNKE